MSNKKRFPLKLFLSLLILIACIIILFTIKNTFNLKIGNPFVKEENISSSEIILKEVRELTELNSIEYIYKMVFPYDLLSPNTDISTILYKQQNKNKLSPDEIKTLSVYKIALSSGIDILDKDFNFAVVKIKIKAGYDFSDNMNLSVNIDKNDNSITLKLPKVSINDVVIEDQQSANYNYPDLNVSPENWRVLSKMLSEEAQKRALAAGIIESAKNSGKKIIEKFLTSAGYENIIFND
ncbi:MAG: DUF4230 domain-containing protein [Spirochaetales bacterium]|nr:DUF4230 domain-containing protein [Spirochaetales bacterium]